eukprot:71165-Alexandrium_andersonii.AAC.1
MAASNLSTARGCARSSWPANLPTALKDLAAKMDEESVSQLLGRPEALVESIVDQWAPDGGEHSQPATGAVWTV